MRVTYSFDRNWLFYPEPINAEIVAYTSTSRVWHDAGEVTITYRTPCLNPALVQITLSRE